MLVMERVSFQQTLSFLVVREKVCFVQLMLQDRVDTRIRKGSVMAAGGALPQHACYPTFDSPLPRCLAAPPPCVCLYYRGGIQPSRPDAARIWTSRRRVLHRLAFSRVGVAGSSGKVR